MRYEKKKNHSPKAEKATKKINKTKTQIFAKIGQTDSCIDKLPRKSKTIQIINDRNERGTIATDLRNKKCMRREFHLGHLLV